MEHRQSESSYPTLHAMYKANDVSVYNFTLQLDGQTSYLAIYETGKVGFTTMR